jgi:hypothetical protein
MLKKVISIVAFFSCIICNAQNDSVNFSYTHIINFLLSYNSSIIYPGASAGVEVLLHQVQINSLAKSIRNKSYTKSRYLAGNVNWYHHPDFHDNLYLTTQWVMSRTNSKGFISEFSFGPGFSRTFLGGTTYRVDNSGGISIVKNAGYNYALLTIGGGFGLDYSIRKQLPISAIVKLNLVAMFPYNSTLYLRPVLELGIRYMPWWRINKIMKN